MIVLVNVLGNVKRLSDVHSSELVFWDAKPGSDYPSCVMRDTKDRCDDIVSLYVRQDSKNTILETKPEFAEKNDEMLVRLLSLLGKVIV
jgi:hypothetical protein